MICYICFGCHLELTAPYYNVEIAFSLFDVAINEYDEVTDLSGSL